MLWWEKGIAQWSKIDNFIRKLYEYKFTCFVKFIYSKKAAKFGKISHIVMTILSNVKSKQNISSLKTSILFLMVCRCRKYLLLFFIDCKSLFQYPNCKKMTKNVEIDTLFVIKKCSKIQGINRCNFHYWSFFFHFWSLILGTFQIKWLRIDHCGQKGGSIPAVSVQHCR